MFCDGEQGCGLKLLKWTGEKSKQQRNVTASFKNKANIAKCQLIFFYISKNVYTEVETT